MKRTAGVKREVYWKRHHATKALHWKQADEGNGPNNERAALFPSASRSRLLAKWGEIRFAKIWRAREEIFLLCHLLSSRSLASCRLLCPELRNSRKGQLSQAAQWIASLRHAWSMITVLDHGRVVSFSCCCFFVFVFWYCCCCLSGTSKDCLWWKPHELNYFHLYPKITHLRTVADEVMLNVLRCQLTY